MAVRTYKPRRIFMLMGWITAVFLAAGPLYAQGDLFGSSDSAEEAATSLVQSYSVLSHTSAAPGKTYSAATVVTIAPEWHINTSTPYQDFLIPAELSFDTLPEVVPQAVTYPPGRDVPLMGEKMSVYDGRVILHFQVRINQDAPPGKIRLPVRVTYQPCNDKECRPPQTVDADLYVTIGAEGDLVEPDVFAVANLGSGDGEITGGEAPEQSELQQLIDTYGFWGYFLALGLAFVTGLLLSFSPCTYPMIPITVSVFAGQQRSMGRGFVLSLFYVVSMAVMYGIMGLIVSLVGGVFGAWLASTPVVIGIAAVFVLFALSMFGLYEFNIPASIRQKLGTTKGGGGVAGSIVLGIVAALVVSPCVGPFVAGILLYIASYGSPIIGFLVLFVFALGLGTFFVIIGTFSSVVGRLPKAGEWMESVKKFFGFVLLLMALYFLRTIIPPAVTAALAGLTLMVLGIFGGGLDRLTPESPFFSRLKKLIGIVALLFGIYFLLGTVISEGVLLPPISEWVPAAVSTQPTGGDRLIPWEIDLESGLARAGAEGKPVLIDTWATWCVNCRVLDKKTFGHAAVAAEAGRFVPVRIQLEKADSPETKAFMQRFGMKIYSLPTVLLLDSRGKTQAILRGVIGPEEMLAEMRRVQ